MKLFTFTAAMIERISPFLLGMKGVSSVGATACEEQTGTPFYKLNEALVKASRFVNCISIGASEKISAQALLILYPNRSKFEDIFINVEIAKNFSAQ
jgi:hypothetical protein